MADTPASLFAVDPDPRGSALRAPRRGTSFGVSGKVALAVVTGLALAAVLAPWLAPFDPNDVLGDGVGLKSLPPSADHWMGTDQSARDLFSRMLFGARISLAIGVMAALLSTVVGTVWGTVAGFAGGWVDAVLMRVVDALLAIPRVLLVLTVVSLWPRTVTALILALGLTGWLAVSRLSRTAAVSVRQREFVAAARALGLSPLHLVWRHVLPHVLGPVLVAATLGLGHAIVLEAGLSFLGVGVPAPTASWGTIIRDGWETFASTWWMTVFPGLALVVTALSVNALAGLLRQRIDPRQLPRQ
jgi:peptide/nickel transport system permease protein